MYHCTRARTRTCIALALAALAAPATPAPVLAQSAPRYIPLQGSLAADDGTPRDGTFDVELRLYEQNDGGTAFYAEAQSVEVHDGLFTAYLGDGDPGDLGDGTDSPALDLDTFVYHPQGIIFLGVTVGDDPEMTPRLQLGTVPFAAFAQTCGDAGTLGGMAAEDFQPATTATCDPAQAVVGLNANGTVVCAAHAGPQGPQGPQGQPGTTSWDGITGVPAGFADGVDDQLTLAGNGSANTAARSDHTHSESDPQVGTIVSNGVPRWDGNALTTGSLRDTGSVVSFTGTLDVGLIRRQCEHALDGNNDPEFTSDCFCANGEVAISGGAYPLGGGGYVRESWPTDNGWRAGCNTLAGAVKACGKIYVLCAKVAGY